MQTNKSQNLFVDLMEKKLAELTGKIGFEKPKTQIKDSQSKEINLQGKHK